MVAKALKCERRFDVRSLCCGTGGVPLLDVFIQ